MRSFANWLALPLIRVNTVHPAGRATLVIPNELMQTHLTSTPAMSDRQGNLLPVPRGGPEGISDAGVWLVAEGGRCVTGVQRDATSA